MSFTSMYIGATGLKTHAEGINNLGHNIANVNTVAYKEMDMHFQNLMSTTVTTGQPPLTVGVSQKGMGAAVCATVTNFNQGAVNPGNSFSDMAIEGKGFFKVVDGSTVHYTRAGNFRFDKDGYLIDPAGFRLQGKAMTGGVPGSLGDVKLNLDDEGFYSIEGEATTKNEMVLNLGMQEEAVEDADNPFFSMLGQYQTTGDQPLATGSYGHVQHMTVYDENGEAHRLNIYFDKVGVSDPNGYKHFEFLVALDRGELSASAAGSLTQPFMTGTLSFTGQGELANVAGFSLASGAGNVQELSNWVPAGFAADGGLALNVNFPGEGSDAAVTQQISLNFGLLNTAGTWDEGAPATASNVGTSISSLPSFTGERGDGMISTAYGGDSSLLYASQDGNPKGYLQSMQVDSEGVITGRYTNGVNKELYQVPLYYFPSQYGLTHEGKNHFAVSPDSGAAIEGTANDATSGLGSVRGNALEASNVDLAEEFVTMISTQRGFQANSKVITTTEHLLQTATNLKR